MSDVILETLLDLKKDVGELGGKMDGVVMSQTNVEARVVAVEGKVNRILGWGVGAGAMGGAAIAFLKAKFGMGD